MIEITMWSFFIIGIIGLVRVNASWNIKKKMLLKLNVHELAEQCDIIQKQEHLRKKWYFGVFLFFVIPSPFVLAQSQTMYEVYKLTVLIIIVTMVGDLLHYSFVIKESQNRIRVLNGEPPLPLKWFEKDLKK